MVKTLISILFVLNCGDAFGLCVTAEQANLRAKPSSKGKLLWTVGKYMPFIALKEKGSWIYVKDLEGKRMWIYSKLVSDDIDCAVIKVSKSSLRKGPGTKHKKTPLHYAFKYTPFRKLSRDDSWLYLRDDYGFKHWVHENNVWEPLAYSNLSY